jgi:hypothetical protein
VIHRAYVESDLPTRTSRLIICRDHFEATDVLLPDGQWFRIPQGARPPEDIGFKVPDEALEPLARALIETLGESLPSVEGNKVLEEALTVERMRVDRIIDKALGNS